MSDRNSRLPEKPPVSSPAAVKAGLLTLLFCCLTGAATSALAADASGQQAAPVEQSSAEDAGSETDAEPAAEADTEVETGTEQESFDERLDRLLAEAQQEEAYGETEHCLFHRKYDEIDIINANMLLFSRGNQYWLNTLKRTCLGLERRMVINVLMSGIGSLCANDLVYANTQFDLQQGWTASGRPVLVRATCSLGEFRRIDETFARALLALEE